jgi:hypothetical protein
VFASIAKAAADAAGTGRAHEIQQRAEHHLRETRIRGVRAPKVPRLTEPWFC